MLRLMCLSCHEREGGGGGARHQTLSIPQCSTGAFRAWQGLSRENKWHRILKYETQVLKHIRWWNAHPACATRAPKQADRQARN
jgi:hypothetical protein